MILWGKFIKHLNPPEKVLPITRQTNNRDAEASTLISLGKIYGDLNRNQKSLEYYKKGSTIYRAEGNNHRLASALNGISTTYNTLGRNQKALSYLQQSLSLYRKVGDRNGAAVALSNIGVVYKTLGKNYTAITINLCLYFVLITIPIQRLRYLAI